VQALRKTRLLSLTELRQTPALAELRVLQKGSRLSITPVDAVHWQQIAALLEVPPGRGS
jgi:predicted RNA-binding protein with PUA-like domain